MATGTKSLSPLQKAERALAPLQHDTSFADTMSGHTTWFERLDTARQFVPYVIARGVFPGIMDSSDSVDQLIYRLARHFEGPYNLADLEAKAEATFRQLNAALSRAGLKGHGVDVGGFLTDGFLAGQEAGYLLGLAVGQQLGPDAFKGGAR